jgi:acylphosphatase
VASADLARAHVRLSGRVQGVGFRYITAAEAQQRRVTGWVRNLDDGGVEAVFEGARATVEDIVRWCAEGPPGAYVIEARVTWDEPPEVFSEFAIRPTVGAYEG